MARAAPAEHRPRLLSGPAMRNTDPGGPPPYQPKRPVM
jgi:hypothetical protein